MRWMRAAGRGFLAAVLILTASVASAAPAAGAAKDAAR